MIVLVEAKGLASHQADMNNRPALPARDLDVIALSVLYLDELVVSDLNLTT